MKDRVDHGELQARIRQLATGNPHRLTLFDAIEVDDQDTAVCETYLHQRLRSKRSRDSEAREFFALTEGEVRGAVREAGEFLREFVPKQREAERLAKETSDGTLLRPGDQEWEWYRRLLDIREAEHGLELERKRLEIQLKLVIGMADGLDRLATWKGHEVRRFDEGAFKIAEPKLYDTFVCVSVQRRFRLL